LVSNTDHEVPRTNINCTSESSVFLLSVHVHSEL
jgi:hypothetical protein